MEKDFRIGKRSLKENLQIALVFTLMFGLIGVVLFVGLKSDAENKYEPLYTGNVEDDMNAFIQSYYVNMNVYGITKTNDFINDYFSDDFKSTMNIEEVNEKLNLYKKAYKDISFSGEVLAVEYDEEGYYIGVTEKIENGDKVIEEYSGIYIVIKDKDTDGYKIDFITGFFDEQETNLQFN